MNLINKLFVSKNNSLRQNYIWNIIYGILFALQSTVILMVLTRTVGIINAGIFTIAFSKATLFCKFGYFGIYGYQATDIKRKYSFNDYLGAGVITFLLVIFISVFATACCYFFAGYSGYKALILLVVCFAQSISPIENIFVAEFQNQNRLDVGCKIATSRLLLGLFILSASLVITHNFLLSLILYLIINIIVFALTIPTTIKTFVKEKVNPVFNKSLGIMKECFFLFLSSFLLFYMTNTPKYAIDAFSTEKIQAIYGFVAMPVFFIDLLSMFIYKPLYNSYTKNWAEKKHGPFIKQIFMQIFFIAIITVVAIIVAYLFGIQILSLLYNTQLTAYKSEMLILLLSGGVMAEVNFIVVIYTIMRKQNFLIIPYIITAIVSYFTSRVFVKNYGINGASYSFLLSISVLAILVNILVVVLIHKNIKSCKQTTDH